MTAELPLIESELPGVLSSLENAGFQTTAIHNHAINERPKLIFLHVQGTGDATALAEAIRSAISGTGMLNTTSGSVQAQFQTQQSIATVNQSTQGSQAASINNSGITSAFGGQGTSEMMGAVQIGQRSIPGDSRQHDRFGADAGDGA